MVKMGRICSFAESLKSIFGLLKVLGFHLYPSSKSVAYEKIIAIISLSLLITNWIISGILAWIIVPKDFKFVLFYAIGMEQEEFARLELVHLGNFILRIIMISTVPAIFNFHSHFTGKWNDALNDLLKIQTEMDLSAKFFSRCTNRCYFGLCLLVLVSCYNYHI